MTASAAPISLTPPTRAMLNSPPNALALRHETFTIQPPANSATLMTLPAVAYCHVILMQQSLYCWVNTQPVLAELTMACSLNTSINGAATVSLLSSKPISAQNKSEELAARLLRRFPARLRQVYCSFEYATAVTDQLSSAPHMNDGDIMADTASPRNIPAALAVERELVQRLATFLSSPNSAADSSPSSKEVLR